MAKERKTKTLHYKRAEIGKVKGTTLQAYLDLALKKKPKPAKRIQTMDDTGSIRRVINSFRRQNGMIFGQMICYEHGKDQTVVVIDDAVDEYKIDHFALQKRPDGKEQEVLESVLFFGVMDNHIVIAQSMALRSKEFENHMRWLLNESTQVFPDNAILMISDQPTEAARKKIEKMPVKSVVLGSALESKTVAEGGQHAAEKAKKVIFNPVGRGFEILEAALGKNWRQGMKLTDTLDEANLYVTLEVSYLRKTTEESHKLLDNIAQSLRHLDPEDVEIKIEGGPSIKGDELKITGPVNVDAYSGVIDSDDMYTQIYDWLSGQLQKGLVG